MAPLLVVISSRIHQGRSPVVLVLIATATLQTGCAVPTTQVGQISRSALVAEQATQQQYVLETRMRQQARLQAVAYPLLESALPMCGDDVARRVGMTFTNVSAFAKDLRDAARAVGYTDTVTVTQVLPGSGAEKAGLQRGDRLLAMDGTSVPVGATAVKDLSTWLARREKASPADVNVTYRRDTTTRTVPVPTEAACDYNVVAVTMDDLNAFSDGRNVYVTTAMLRFAADDGELATVVGHEIGHNAMHHMDARKRNVALGTLFGAIVDVAAAANGVNTHGDFTSQFGQLGAMVFSQDFEREADYVGLYIVARSGRPVHDAADLWRHMAAENPGAIKFASSHPTTAERFLRLKQFAAEIETKQSSGLALVPEMRKHTPPNGNPEGRVLVASGERRTSCGMAVCTTAIAAAREKEQAPAQRATVSALTTAVPSHAAASAPVTKSPAETLPGSTPATGNGAIPVHVVVRVPDWIVGNFLNVRDYPVLVIGPVRDTTVARTDETGTATFALKPGHYRIVPSRSDRVAARQRYEWDVEFDVTSGMPSVELTEANGKRRGR